MFTLKRLVTSTALMLLLTAAAHGVVEGVEGEDYDTGALIVKFDRPIEIGEEDGVITTGIPEIDAINVDIGAYNFKQVFRLPDEPRDDERGKWTWEDLLNAYEKRGLGNVYLVEFDEGKATVSYAVDEYEGTEVIEFAEPNYYGYACDTDPNDGYYPNQWYLHGTLPGCIHANKGWDYETGDSSFTIAIIDTGINIVHPDLMGKIDWAFDYPEGHDRPLDIYSKELEGGGYSYGHGTQVTGIATAITNNRTNEWGPWWNGGVAGLDWHARIFALKVWYKKDNGEWAFDISTLSLAIWDAACVGADVINMSLAFNGWSPTIHDTCEVVYDDLGALLIAAAGNDGPGHVRYPAKYASVIAVSAIDYDAEVVREPKWSWSSSTGDEVELCAPGVGLFTTDVPDDREPIDGIPDYDVDPEVDGYEWYNRYRYFGGTSGAAPIVSGVATLFWATHPAWTNEQVRDALAKTARDLGPGGRDDEYGWGCVDPAKGLYELTGPHENNGGTGFFMSQPDENVLLEVAPNPASTALNVAVYGNSTVSAVKVYDLSGRLVYSAEVAPYGEVINWDLENSGGTRVGAGVYIITVEAGEERIVKKAVIY